MATLLSLAMRMHAAVVQTLDGQSFEGTVAFNPGILRITQGSTGMVAVPLTNLLSAVFSSATTQDAPLLGRAGGGWMSRDVGNVTIAGRAGQSNDLFTVKGAAASSEKKADGFHFIYQPVIGDAELVARVIAVHGADLHARAFVTVRESLAAEGQFALLGLSAGGQLRFQNRNDWTPKTRRQNLEVVALPHWLRLVRKGNEISAYHASNGRDWKPAGSTNLSLGESNNIGMAVSSPGRFALAEAAFDHVRLTVSGLQGDYFAGEDFKHLKLSRVDPRVDLWWGWGSPGEGVPEDHFSARWSGQLEPGFSEEYTFHLEVEDPAQQSARLWINSQCVASTSSEKTPNGESSAAFNPIRLQANRRCEVMLEYRKAGGSASLRLRWSSRSQPREIIPGPRLSCTPRLAMPPAETSPNPADRQSISATGLLLSDGSFAAGDVRSVDGSKARLLFRGEREMTIPTARVAAVFLRVPRRQPSLDSGRTGVLLGSGDWFEGEIRKIESQTVKVSSVLLGPRSFGLDDVAALFLRPASAGLFNYEVRTVDSSVLRCKSIGLTAGAMTCEEEILGTLSLPLESLVEIRRIAQPYARNR